MNQLRLQRGATWCGVAMTVCLVTSFMLAAGLVPPLSPTASAQAVTQFFIEHKMRIRIGLALSMLGTALGLPFFATVCLRIRRAEHGWGVLSVTQTFCGVLVVPGLVWPMMFLGAAAFRPGQRPPEITQALDDLFWLMFIGIVGTFVVQAISLGIATFIDNEAPRTFPRWFGFFNFWVAMANLPGSCVVIFNDGPLAWNGVFAFWIPLVVFFSWMVVLCVVLLRSISAEAASTATKLTG